MEKTLYLVVSNPGPGGEDVGDPVIQGMLSVIKTHAVSEPSA